MTLWVALQACEVHIKALENIVRRERGVLDGSNRGMSRTWSSLGFVSRRRDIEEIEEALHRSMGTLHMAMTLDVMQSSTPKSVAIAQIQPTAQPSDNGDRDLALGVTSTYTVQQRIKSHRQSNTIFGSISYQTIDTVHRTGTNSPVEDSNPTNSNSNRILFVPSFLSFSMEFTSRRCFGQVSRSLRTFPLIDKANPIFRLCATGDLTSLQSLLAARSVSPYSMTGDGWTLLHEAAFYSQPEVCRLLINLGSDRNQTTHNGFTPLQRVARLGSRRRESPDTVSTIRALLSGPHSDFHLANLPGFFQYYFGPPAGIKLLLDREIVGIEPPDIQASATEALLGSLSKYGASQNPEWKPILGRLVRMGADIHHLSSNEYSVNLDWHAPGTPLNRLLDWFHDALESKYFLDEWLAILADAGRNVEQYVMNESEIRAKCGIPVVYVSHGPRFHPRRFMFSTNPPAIWFEWWIDPLSSAVEVLEEYKNLGPLQSFDDGDDELEGNGYWPCSLEWWEQFVGPLDPDFEVKSRRKALVDERFRRRERRKEAKYYKALGFRDRRRMPGAWEA
ncbi:hypothetical protein BJX99DRAFT_235317 [Aspergillus californicus]